MNLKKSNVTIFFTIIHHGFLGDNHNIPALDRLGRCVDGTARTRTSSALFPGTFSLMFG